MGHYLHISHQIISRHVYEDKDYPMLMSMYLGLVARTLLINQMVFSEVLQGLSQRDPFEKILEVWLNRMSCVTSKDKKKLLGLALASLLPVQTEQVSLRVPVILNRLCETLNDIMKEDDETGVVSE